MRKNLVGVTTLAVALSSVTMLSTSYAGTATFEPTVPDHALIQAPIRVSDVAAFQDASTLWLTDALVAQGAKVAGRKTKFNETTLVHTSISKGIVNETVLRHKTWSGLTVGADPALVTPLSREQYAMLANVINNRLTAELQTNLTVDQNGIHGTLTPADLGVSEDELLYEAEQTANKLGIWLAPNCP